MTVVGATASGSITAYADGTALPSAQNLVYAASATTPNLVIAPVGADGYIDLYNTSTGSVDLIADASGYFTPTSVSEYQAVTPFRLLDTRSGVGTGGRIAKVGPNTALAVTVAGANGATVPASGVTAVTVGLITVGASASGVLTAYPDGTSLPLASNINFAATGVFANAAVVPVGADGKIDLDNASTGSTDFVADVFGYFTGSATNAAAYIPAGPTRILDTRQPDYPISGPLAGNTLYQLPTLSAGMGITGIVANATVLNEAGGGYLKFYPSNTGSPSEVPVTSNVDFAANTTQTRLTIDTLGTTADVYGLEDLGIENVSSGATDLLLDLAGIFDSE